jgi:hypothetical protein
VNELACYVAFCSNLMCLRLLLGFVEHLVPPCLGILSKFICNGKSLGELKNSIAKFVCLLGFHKVWVLALHGFSLLICPKPLGHDSSHREVN